MQKTKPQPRPKAKIIQAAYPLRIIAFIIVLGIHLSQFYGQSNPYLWSFILVHTLIYPHLVYYFSSKRQHEQNNVLIDSFIYGCCLALWGFNSLSIIVIVCGLSMTSFAAGGLASLLKSQIILAIGMLVGGTVYGFYYQETLSLIATLITAIGLLGFSISLGVIVYKVNTDLVNAQRKLSKQTEQLIESNELAQAINAHLELDKIMERVIQTLNRLYPFEQVYITLYDEKNENLTLLKSYGKALTNKDHSHFEGLTFSSEIDKNSIFVRPILENKPLYIKDLKAETVAQSGAPIDQRLYLIKPSKSVICFPLSVEEKVIGGIGFVNYENSLNIDSDDIKKLADYIVQVGTAIRNSQLFEQAKQAGKEALLAQQEAEASEATKSHFLANMSHEIRTPMTAIIGYSESLRDEHLSVNEKQQFVETIIRSGKHLLTIINDILDLSKIEANKLEVEQLEVPLANLIRDLYAHISIKAEEKGLTFNISPILPLPTFFTSDSTRIKQILFNLASNAVKFTHHGTINILIRYEEESDTLYFEVKDTGIGLTADQKNKVFEPFTQADSTTTRKYGGTGLGLYISKQLAHLLDGELYVDSQPGLGSEFVLAFHPGNLSEASWFRTQESLTQEIELVNAVLEKTNTVQFEGKILLAEDNPENQRLFLHLFKIMGLDVTVVDNGKKAVAAISSTTFDLALLDIQMPEMGGEEAAIILKKQQNHLPLIALTANVMQHQIDNYLKIGFSDVIGKPFDRKHFYQILKNHLPEKKRSIKGRVLIAEDNPVNLKLLKRQVEKVSKDIIVTCAVNGAEAVEEAKNTLFDLILMDMEMPVMNGLDALKILSKNDDTPPVYMVTGNINQEDIKSCLKEGANGHIAKPIDLQQLETICINTLSKTS